MPKRIYTDILVFFGGLLFGAIVYWGGYYLGEDKSFNFVISLFEYKEWGGVLINFLTSNLGYSMIAFTLVIILYSYFILKLKRGLINRQLNALEIKQLLTRIHTLSSLFFGIGVLWTAIGMRGALLSALGNLDENSAALVGAFEILRRLVDGGILVALSTTIVGGFGGYLMKLIETFYVSADVQAFFDNEEIKHRENFVNLITRSSNVNSH